MSEFTCFKCGDGNTPLYCLNCAGELRSSHATPTGELLPCPFCGGDAESDHMQPFRRITDGQLSNAVSIYCTKCSAQISMCHDDHKEYAPVDMMTILIEAWNVRVAMRSPQS